MTNRVGNGFLRPLHALALLGLLTASCAGQRSSSTSGNWNTNSTTATVNTASHTTANANAVVTESAMNQTVVFLKNDGAIGVTFTEADMAAIGAQNRAGNAAGALGLVERKFVEAGVKCCEPRKRLDECTWRCCDNSIVKIVGCNSQLRTAMEGYGR